MSDDDLKGLFDALQRRVDESAAETRRQIEETAAGTMRLEEKMDRGFAETQAMIRFSPCRARTARSRVERLEATTH